MQWTKYVLAAAVAAFGLAGAAWGQSLDDAVRMIEEKRAAEAIPVLAKLAGEGQGEAWLYLGFSLDHYIDNQGIWKLLREQGYPRERMASEVNAIEIGRWRNLGRLLLTEFARQSIPALLAKAEAGSVEAMINLAHAYSATEDQSGFMGGSSTPWLEKAASMGSARAALLLWGRYSIPCIIRGKDCDPVKDQRYACQLAAGGEATAKDYLAKQYPSRPCLP